MVVSYKNTEGVFRCCYNARLKCIFYGLTIQIHYVSMKASPFFLSYIGLFSQGHCSSRKISEPAWQESRPDTWGGLRSVGHKINSLAIFAPNPFCPPLTSIISNPWGQSKALPLNHLPVGGWQKEARWNVITVMSERDIPANRTPGDCHPGN